jgi:pilus assembly protein CpaB
MNKRLLLILLSAFLVASACSFLVYRLVAKSIHATAPRDTKRVVVAATDIKLGSILRDVDLTTAEISGNIPKGAITNPKDAIGRGVISSLSQNEPILESRLAAAGAGGGLAATISPGMRACAIKVDDVVGVAGFVTPGMRVDVLISGNPPGDSANSGDGTRVKTLLQNIEVLSAGTDIQKDDEGKAKPVQVVNLLVTPDQAEALSLASAQTHIQLVLRNPLDTQIGQPSGTAVANLFNGKENTPTPKPRTTPAVRPVSAPASRTYLVQVYNGSKRTDEKFVSNGEK